MSPTEGRTQNICVKPDLCAQNICVTPGLCFVNNFNGKDGYFTWRRTWKNLKNVARHVLSVGISLSAPWADSLVVIALKPVKKWLDINPMGHSAPGDDSLDIIALQIAKKILPGINPVGSSTPRAYSLDINAFQTVKKLRGINPPDIMESINSWQI